MTIQEIKDIMTEVFMRVDSDSLQADDEQFWETFNHINELIDVEIEGRLIIAPCKMTTQEMTNGEMIETLKKIMVDYNCGYKVLTKDGSYAYPFKNEIDALTHSIGLLEREEQK